ncbi:MAG: hypothetical protein J6K48_07725 [Lachnospiraceae bacterium]|nr:hypothetical protein [Lachnospiraceae bacterium]
MMKIEDAKKRKFYIVCFVIIWVVQMVAAFYFCTLKQGFHEDEYYTYYSTARTNGFYVEDGQWMDQETYRNEFVVLAGQQFQYGLVKQVQSWDVHPPVYYWVFHTVASMVPGVFSKWIGLSVNLFFHGINIILLTYLSYLVSDRCKMVALIVTLFYGLTPAAVSGVVFIRMYEMLTMWVLLCALLHVRAVKKREEKLQEEKLSLKGFLLPIALVTYLGFLTQYYYFIFLFFMGVAFCIYLLWRDRSIGNCLRYGISQITAFVLAYLTYPSCLGQMFRGQRGAQATENFMDLSNTAERLRFFYDLLDEYVFGKMLTWLLLLAVILVVTVYAMAGRRRLSGRDSSKQNSQSSVLRESKQTATRRKGKADIAFWLLMAAVIGYFLTVSKTALLLGDTSNRYQLPVYGMIVLLLFDGIYRLGKQCILVSDTSVASGLLSGEERTEASARKAMSKMPGYLGAAAVVICLLVDLSGLAGGRVVFLYPEDKQQAAFAKERAEAGTPVVYVYQTGAEWCIWDVTNELLEYPAVYFVSADSEDLIEDDRIAEAKDLVVYLADGVDSEEQLSRITAKAMYLKDRPQLLFEEKYCDVYYVR